MILEWTSLTHSSSVPDQSPRAGRDRVTCTGDPDVAQVVLTSERRRSSLDHVHISSFLVNRSGASVGVPASGGVCSGHLHVRR
ncbi:hypothetical protein R3I94_016753 [Phoxinus phoxinus]|uniref:Uncharacterized protein n=1 Tax=Phoxinus phoxinus TaxID=58324 RepID=A0AAN9GZM5_9TELE